MKPKLNGKKVEETVPEPEENSPKNLMIDINRDSDSEEEEES